MVTLTRTSPERWLEDGYFADFFNPFANPRYARLLRIFKYLAVPSSLVSYCKYLLSPLCHGRGRSPNHLGMIGSYSFNPQLNAKATALLRSYPQRPERAEL